LPRLVVAMPAYNAEKTIVRAVSSTLRAMPKDSELLVLDDKSTDRTLELLDTVRDHRLRVIAGETNVGGPKARRRLLEDSDSELYASMDADDISMPWRFFQQFKALKIADVLFSSAIRFGTAAPGGTYKTASNTFIPKLSAPVSLKPHEFPAALMFHNPVWHPSLFAKRQVIENVGGYNPGRGDDWDLWLRIAVSGASMYRLALPVIAYRESSLQASRQSSQPDGIRANSSLRASYIALFNSLVRSEALSECLSDAEKKRILMMGLHEIIDNFRPVNRLHYLSFLRFQRVRATKILTD